MCHPDGWTCVTLPEPAMVRALSFACRHHSNQLPAFSRAVPAQIRPPLSGCLASSAWSTCSPGACGCFQWFSTAAKMLRASIICALSGFKLQKKLSSTRHCFHPLLHGLRWFNSFMKL